MEDLLLQALRALETTPGIDPSKYIALTNKLFLIAFVSALAAFGFFIVTLDYVAKRPAGRPVRHPAITVGSTAALIFAIGGSYVYANHEDIHAVRAVHRDACHTALGAIARGDVSLVTAGMADVMENRCGDAAFMAAVNAPTSRVALTIPSDL